jgi:hypothetical protein
VKLINTDGLAFIGPGSEWFWAALSGIVLAVTFVAIYRQLRLQSHAGAIEQVNLFERELNSERMCRYKVDVLVALRDGSDRADIPDAAAQSLANFWERVAILTRGGHLDRGLLSRSIGFGCVYWWATLEPYIRRTQGKQDATSLTGPPPYMWRAYGQFEWLAGVMVEMDRRGGLGVTHDEGTLANWRDRDIAAFSDRIRVEQALRTVTIASPEVVAGGQAVADQRRTSGPASGEV